MSVQILTVPSVAQHLIEKYNAFHNLVEYFLNIFQDEAQYNDEKLDLTEWMDDRPMYYRRCNHIINDIEYLLSVTPEEWSNDLRTNFVEGAKKFIDLSKLLHLADPHTMQTSAHVEYESKNWACVFHITNPLMSIANLVKSWCKKDKAALSPIFK